MTAAGTPGLAAGRARRLLVIGETAMAFVLLVGAGLMLATVSAALKSDVGFDTRGLLSVRVSPPSTRFTSVADAAAWYDRLVPELASIPGIRSVGVSSQVPLSGDRSGTSFFLPGMRLERNQSPPGGELAGGGAGLLRYHGHRHRARPGFRSGRPCFGLAPHHHQRARGGAVLRRPGPNRQVGAPWRRQHAFPRKLSAWCAPFGTTA